MMWPRGSRERSCYPNFRSWVALVITYDMLESFSQVPNMARESLHDGKVSFKKIFQVANSSLENI